MGELATALEACDRASKMSKAAKAPAFQVEGAAKVEVPTAAPMVIGRVAADGDGRDAQDERQKK